jgi:hypothetical protein
VGIETDQEFECITSFMKSNNESYKNETKIRNSICIDTLRLSGKFWTSGTNEGALSADNPGWCSTKQFAHIKTWDNPDTRPYSLFQSRYLALLIDVNHRDEIGLESDLESLRFLCESL